MKYRTIQTFFRCVLVQLVATQAYGVLVNGSFHPCSSKLSATLLAITLG